MIRRVEPACIYSGGKPIKGSQGAHDYLNQFQLLIVLVMPQHGPNNFLLSNFAIINIIITIIINYNRLKFLFNQKISVQLNQNIHVEEKMAQKQDSLEAIFKKAPQQPRYLLKLLARGRHLGFDNFINRKLIWPFLLNLQYDKIQDYPPFQWKAKIDRNSTDYQQLQKDAQRSLSSMKTFENISKIHLYVFFKALRKKRQDDVLMVLDNFFGHHSELRYIQGFHDVASVFLTIFGNNIGYYMLQKAGKIYFHDFLRFDVGHIGIVISQIVLNLVVAQDKEFQEIFSCFRESKFLIFIIPWIFTWFAHVFSSLKTICRIWDYILCTGPFGAIYLTAGIILSTKKELVESCEEFDEPNIQSFYQRQAKNQTLDVQKAIQKAIELQQTINVKQLPAYAKFKQESMFRFQNFYKQIELLEKHEKYMEEKKNIEKRNKLLKTAAFFIATAGVAVVAYKYNGWKNIIKGSFGQL